MNNKITTILLFIPFLAVTLWATYYLRFIEQNMEVTLPITGYDPRNLLSGHYIRYQIDWKNANCAQFKADCPVHEFAPSDRYYVPEDKARQLEHALNNRNVSIVFAYRKGSKPIAKFLLIDGKPWQEAM